MSTHVRRFLKTMPSCWVEVNTDAIRHNYRAIKHLVGDSEIMSVVKANAYGHGAVEVSRVLTDEGSPYLAVTRLEEALPLRAAGLLTPILLLTPALPDEVDEVVAQNLTACISCYEDGARLSAAAAKRGIEARAHLKINTGMGRLGVEPEEAAHIAGTIAQFRHVALEAAWTHFAHAAERDPTDTHLQFSKFQPQVHFVSRAAGIKPNQFHCCNSAALLRFPSMRLSMVRPGTILYGQYPSSMAKDAAEQQRVSLREAFAVKARIVAIQKLGRGQGVGYGGEWRAPRPSLVATIAVGYADGLTQEPNARSKPADAGVRNSMKKVAKSAVQMAGFKRGETPREVQIEGESAPIIGRVAMQQCSIDITHLRGVEVGDTVSVSMRRTSAGAHLPRVYVTDSSNGAA